jgi:hypothetical protein
VLALGAWILDTGNTVKPLYGKQESAVKIYKPKKTGRPRIPLLMERVRAIAESGG